MNGLRKPVQAVIVTVLVLFVGLQMVDVATSESFQEYVEESEAWCEEKGGELYNAQVIGEHGGLHCELPDGTSVHMDDVVQINASG